MDPQIIGAYVGAASAILLQIIILIGSWRKNRADAELVDTSSAAQQVKMSIDMLDAAEKLYQPQINQLRLDVESLRVQLQGERVTRVTLQQQLDNTRSELATAKAQIKQLVSESESNRARLQQVEKHNHELAEKNRALVDENERLKKL